MSLSIAVLAFVTLQRLGELVLARSNTRRLKAQGAYEVGARHYPLIVGMHAAWLIGLWVLAWNRPVNLPLLGAFAVLQVLRLWVIASLGPRWTTRVIVLPGEPLVRRGPYRFMRHPNYRVVTFEIAILPLVFGLWIFALVFTLLNAIVLAVRLRVEGEALRIGGDGETGSRSGR